MVGCTRQACGFNKHFEGILALGRALIGADCMVSGADRNGGIMSSHGKKTTATPTTLTREHA